MQSSFLTSRANPWKRSPLNQQFQYNLSLRMLRYSVITIFSSPEQAPTCFRLEEKIHQKLSPWRWSKKKNNSLPAEEETIRYVPIKKQLQTSSNIRRAATRKGAGGGRILYRLPLFVFEYQQVHQNRATTVRWKKKWKKRRRIAHQTLSATITREEETKHR